MFRGLRVGESELNRFKSLPLILIQVQSNLHCSVSGKSRAGDPIPALDPATAGDPIPTLAPATGFKMFLVPTPKWLGPMKIVIYLLQLYYYTGIDEMLQNNIFYG